MLNSGRISPEKQRLPVSTKLASCPGDSVSRRRSSAPPFPIQISARPHFPSIRGLLLPDRTSYYPASAPGLSAAPLPTGSAIRVQPPASCPPGLALQPGLHFSAATSPAQSPASRLDAPGLASPSWTRLPSSELRSSSRVSAPRPAAVGPPHPPAGRPLPPTGSLAQRLQCSCSHPSSWQNKGPSARTVPTSSVIPEQLQARTGPWEGCWAWKDGGSWPRANGPAASRGEGSTHRTAPTQHRTALPSLRSSVSAARGA